ncbi:MAG TPA: HAD family hydrolase [Xanthobacteraceae bacterium]|nr:HAD family hydrolase [Xanthobacteraceae bacterium]
MTNRAVFLDRDGVLNRAPVVDGVPQSPASVAELEVLPGVAQACALLHKAGFRLIVATNQPNIARGLQTRQTVDAINAALRRALNFDDLYMCVHDDADRCDCRKPRPGMLLAAARAHGLDLAACVMVGDRDRDIAAGRAAGCRTVFVDHGYAKPPDRAADLTVASLRAAVDWIIARAGPDAKERA